MALTNEQNKMINVAMEERRRKFEKYAKYAKSFDSFLKTVNLFKILDYSKGFLSLPTAGKIATGGLSALLGLVVLPIAETLKFTLATLTSPLRLFGVKPVSFRPMLQNLYQVAKHAGEPEMQKLLVEKTCLLDKIGENKDIVKGLVKSLALTGRVSYRLCKL